MNNLDIQDLSEATLIALTEEEMAHWLRQRGTHVIYHRGRYWHQTYPGLYQPVHVLARLSKEQATRPTKLCWGFRTALSDDDLLSANGSIPVHLLSDITNYSVESLPQKCRTHLRKCRKRVKFVQLIGSSLLEQQGYEVVCSSLERTQSKNPPSKEEYLAKLADYNTHKHWLIIAGLIDGKLGGYIEGWAVDRTAYMISGYYATEALSTSIVTGLTYEFVQVCRRSGNVDEVADGLHLTEAPGLDSPKKKMGFPVKYIPSRVSLNPMIGNFIRWRNPHKYYRLTGQFPAQKA